MSCIHCGSNQLHAVRQVVVVNQHQVALALRIKVEELAPVALLLDEFAVGVDVAVGMAGLPEERALGLGAVRAQTHQTQSAHSNSAC